MTDYELATAISTIISSYREGEISKRLDCTHVMKWVNQFEEADRSVILQETFHILTRQFYSRERIENILDGYLEKIRRQYDSFDKIVFVNSQKIGSSQKILYDIIESRLGSDFQRQSSDFIDASKIYLYVDDGFYTGRRAWTDLTALVEELPQDCRLQVFYLFAYSNSFDYRMNIIRSCAAAKGIDFSFECGQVFYNDRNHKAASIDFVWPNETARANREVEDYEKILLETGKANFLYYNCVAYQQEKGMFSSYAAENQVSSAFLKYGIKICNRIAKIKFRPLGFTTPPSFGFGSFAVTAYNISNTAPLVLWWGNLEDNDDSPIGCWYPLFPRRNNEELYTSVERVENAVSIVKCRPILKTVYGLAVEENQMDNERNRSEHGDNRIIDLMSLNLEELRERRRQSNLLNYLHSLDFQDLKIVQTVMYLGRDYNIPDYQEYSYDEYDEYEGECRRQMPRFPVSNPDLVLREWLQDFDEMKGWKTKEIEAEQIYQKKSRLPEYLQRAFDILGI